MIERELLPGSLALLLAALVLAGGPLAGRSTPLQAEPAARALEEQALPAGHRRMLELLADEAARAAVEDTFVGTGRKDELIAQLQAFPEGGDALEKWELLTELAFEELSLGLEEASVGHYEDALRLQPELVDRVEPWLLNQTGFDLAIACLRLGETKNCVARHTSDSCIFPIREQGVHVDQEGARKAIQYLGWLLDAAPDSASLRWLINVAYMTVGAWPDEVPERHALPPGVVDSDEEFPRFRDVAPERGLAAFTLSGGSILDDFDGDGLLDIMASTWDPSGQLLYYRGKGDGTFDERSAEAGLSGLFGGLNILQADYDDDGDLDVLVLRGAWRRMNGRIPNSLLRNDGHGRFTDVTFEAGLGESHHPTQTAAWADYDLDGDLDLYVGNEHERECPAPSQLFRNEGQGTFVDVARSAGVANMAYAKAVHWGDYDGDRYPDLYVSNLNGPNKLYRNQGNGSFKDMARQLGVDKPLASFPAWFWDFDNDGNLDIFVSCYTWQLEPFAASYLGLPTDHERPRLYRGDGTGGFTDVAHEMGMDRIVLPMGSSFGDLDNDGFLDVYLGTGFPNFEGLMPNVLYRNRAGRAFADVTTAAGLGHLQKGHGVAIGDVDRDGDQDIFVEMGGAFPGDAFGNALFEHPGCDGSWIKVQLVGSQSNRFGLGARIRCEVQEDGQRRSIYKHVNSGGTFGASPLCEQMIGLGRAERVEVLEVYWPASDRTRILRGVEVGRTIRIREDEPD